MSTFSALTGYAQVRRGFTEECVYREALGGSEPLRCFVMDGPLDAPVHMPAGGMKSSLGTKVCPAGYQMTTERSNS